jgi:F-box domain
MENILLRLPMKSIARCRLTCKAWASLTSTPHCIHQHLKNQTNSDPVTAINYRTGEQCNTCFSSNHSMEAVCTFKTLEFKFPYGFIHIATHYRMSTTCNGLVCIYRAHNNKNNFTSIVNPSIRETIQLPESSFFLIE